ncbi:MAG: hypothetical protein H3C64_12370 [Candidatus Kuenenia stuttgartiensis]|nr:hypothetical protein [Candidatus Kuenenia stuttgartiensis]GJQ47689.1 MAG: hypothetical protein HKUEN01_00750 [Candidatus Kuenenia stuttgartiensis]
MTFDEVLEYTAYDSGALLSSYLTPKQITTPLKTTTGIKSAATKKYLIGKEVPYHTG